MKIRKKIIVYLLIIVFIMGGISVFISKSNTSLIKGDIVIWTNDKYFSYFNSISREFKKNNKRVNIEVVSIKEEDYLDKILNTEKKLLPNIVHLNFMEIDNIKDKINFTAENKEIIETYSKNFNKSRLQEVKIDDNYYAVPFTSNPIGLFLRSDILSEFGYSVEDVSTWKQLLKIGSDIYNKSNGEISIFSSKDRDNINLLLAAQLVDLQNKNYSNREIIDNINSIYNSNFTNDNNYICRLDSLNFYKELNDSNIDGVWECRNPPTFNIGENRFYDIGGENLVALKIDNEEAIKSFISYAATNKELLSKELLNSNFVPSSLYSLKIKQLNENIDNSGNNPFLVLSNIVERAPEITNYELFKDIVYDIYH